MYIFKKYMLGLYIEIYLHIKCTLKMVMNKKLTYIVKLIWKQLK